MKWRKKGLIYKAGMFDIPWHTKYTMTPVPYLYKEDILRIYLTMCNSENIGQLGYIDVDPSDPRKIIGYSKKPILEKGAIGTFDEHGVLPSSILKDNNKLYMFYSAYQRQITVPYTILSGIAVSNDGDFFTRLQDVPLLERRTGELFQRSAIEIMKQNKKYCMWYTSSIGWINNGIHDVPKYNIKYIESENLYKWEMNPVISLDLDNNDEYGLTTPQIFFENGKYRMFYSIRSLSKGYRMGYAESLDGIKFNRMDMKMNLEPSVNEFDSEMICYGKIFNAKDKTYLFYSGNHYGLEGIGYAELEEF